MKVTILYRPKSDHARQVEEYQREFTHRTGKKLSLLNIDTVAGAEKAKLYDIVRYPAVIATADDGQLLKMWQDELLPTINEVSFFVQDQQI